MKFKDLNNILTLLQTYKNEIPHGVRLDGMKRDLYGGEIIALTYYKAITDYLVSQGYMENQKEIDFNLLQADSSPQEDDYE